MKQKRQRIIGIDICRSFAIIAAMGSHSLVASGGFEMNHNAAMTVLRFFMQLSPPLFIGLFGSMLQIAYRPKFAGGDFDAGVRQLLSRAAQCYLLYVTCVAIRFAMGDFSLGYALRCAFLIGVTPFVDILKFYAIMLLVAPAAIFIATRYRLGLAVLIAVSLLPHLAYPLMSNLPLPPPVFGKDYLSFPASFLYGGAPGAGGPSLLHGFFFVFIGMLIGQLAEKLLSSAPGEPRQARRSLLLMLIVSGGISVALWTWQDPYATVRAISDMSLRNHNHPTYFALGTFAMTAAAWVALELYDRRGATFGKGVVFIGSSSLFTFSFGNMLLIAAPKFTLSPAGSLLYGLVLLVAILLLSWSFRRILEIGARQDLEGRHGLARRFYRAQTGLVAAVQRLIIPFGKFYSSIMSANRRPEPAV